jgi:hypothetical protein
VRLERGFRRIIIVLSVLLLGIGIVLNVMLVNPHASVQVTLKDGRKFAVERHGPKDYLTDRDSLAYALKNGAGVYKGGLKSPPAPKFTPVDKAGRPLGRRSRPHLSTQSRPHQIGFLLRARPTS